MTNDEGEIIIAMKLVRDMKVKESQGKNAGWPILMKLVE